MMKRIRWRARRPRKLTIPNLPLCWPRPGMARSPHDGHRSLQNLFALSYDAIQAVDLPHFVFRQLLFGNRAVHVEVFGHGIEFKFRADEYHTRIQVGGDVRRLVTKST